MHSKLQKFLSLANILGFKGGMSHPIFIEAFQNGNPFYPQRPQMLRVMILASCIEKQDTKINQLALTYSNFVKGAEFNTQKYYFTSSVYGVPIALSLNLLDFCYLCGTVYLLTTLTH